MITANKFNGHIKALTKLDADLQDRLIQSLSYIYYQGALHGNADPAKKWADSGLPAWIKRLGKKAEAKKVKGMDAETAEKEAQECAREIVERAFRDQAEARAKAAEARKAKAEEAKEKTAEADKAAESATKAQKAKARAEKKAREEKARADEAEAKAQALQESLSSNTLVVDGTAIPISKDEAEALQEFLQELRAPQTLKAVNG